VDTVWQREEDDWASVAASWDARRVIRMLKLSVLCAALFCLSLTVSAQDSTEAFDATSMASEPPAPSPLIPVDREAWQIGVGFQYLQFNVLGQKFHDFGYKADVTRYFNNWFGLEGAAIGGFGHTGANSSIVANSFFIGGGPHFSMHYTGRFEPWAHVLIGLQHFRFTQGGTIGSNNFDAIMAGGGVDYKIGTVPIFWRIQGDFIGTNIGSSMTKNYSVGTGFIFNF
jgi:hypothetical protein